MDTPDLYSYLALPACSYSSLLVCIMRCRSTASEYCNKWQKEDFTELLCANREGVSPDQHGIIYSQTLWPQNLRYDFCPVAHAYYNLVFAIGPL